MRDISFELLFLLVAFNAIVFIIITWCMIRKLLILQHRVHPIEYYMWSIIVKKLLAFSDVAWWRHYMQKIPQIREYLKSLQQIDSIEKASLKWQQEMRLLEIEL